MTKIVDVPSFDEFAASFREIIEEIVMLIDCPKNDKELIRSPIHVFIRRAFLAPASQSHHDSDSGGLVRHVLEVVRQTLRMARRDPRYEYKDRLAAFACALLHDAFRPWNLIIEAAPGEESPPGITVPKWLPHAHTMARWVQDYHVRRAAISWKPKEEVYGQTEGAAVFLMGYIFPEAFAAVIGQRRITQIAKALLHHAPENGELLFQLFKGADRACAAANSRAIGSVDYGRLRVALQAAISVVKDWNQPPFRFLASSTHALLPYPTTEFDQVGLRFWREVFELIATQTGKSHQLNDLGTIMLEVFNDDFVSLGDTSSRKAEFVAHAIVNEQTHACIAVPWTAISGPGNPRPKISAPPPAWRLRSRNPKLPLTVTPEDLGFLSLSDTDARTMFQGQKVAALWKLLVPNPASRDEMTVSQAMSSAHGIPGDLQDLALSILVAKVTAQQSPLVGQGMTRQSNSGRGKSAG